MKPQPMSAPRNLFAMLGPENIFATILVKRSLRGRAEGGNLRQGRLGSVQEPSDAGHLGGAPSHAALDALDGVFVDPGSAEKLRRSFAEEILEILELLRVAEGEPDAHEAGPGVDRESADDGVMVRLDPGVKLELDVRPRWRS